MKDPQKSAVVKAPTTLRQEEATDAFGKASQAFLNRKENPNQTFINAAHGHLMSLARAKAKKDKEGMLKHHSALDSLVHGFAGKRPGE